MNRQIPNLRFWLTFLVVCAGLSYACIEGSYTWRGRFDVQFFGLIVFGGGLVAWLFWRGLVRRAALPHTGLGWVFVLGMISVSLSLIFSHDPRQSLWRVAWLASYVLLFYILIDGFGAGWLERNAALIALLTVSGIVILLALLETYAWYLRWFAAVGNGEWPLFQYRFGSIFGYSNVLMSLANLCAPLALIVFLRSRSRLGRVGAALWLLLYLIAIPFSSSRGGWMGLAGWVGVFVLVWLVYSRPWRQVFHWRWMYRWFFMVGLLAGLAVVVLLGIRFWLAFAAHPSHGGDLLGGRGYLWAYAIDLWQRSPLVGIGPGRYTLEHPTVNPNVPPQFWSYNAHGMPVEVLTEFGLLGAVVLALLVGIGGWILWKRWRMSQTAQETQSNRSLYALALLAGLAAWLCQMIVDDFTSWIAIMVPLILMAAWIFTAPQERLVHSTGRLERTFFHLDVNVMWLPALLLLAYSIWDLWGYAPVWVGLMAAEDGRWTAAATSMEAGAKRDPMLDFYATEKGLAEAWAWGETGDPSTLEQARVWLRRSTEHEPQLSPLWANLAALDWQAGESDMALDGMRRAMAQSPKESSYPLNLGYYLEVMGQLDEAAAAYQLALDLAPEWQSHPFWKLTPLRAWALASWRQMLPGEIEGLDTAEFELALREGDLALARYFLARAGIRNDVTAYQGRLSEASGNVEGAIAIYRGLRDLLDLPILRRGSNFSFAYTHWAYNRPGLIVDRVPGYLNLDGDAELYSDLERLHTLEVQRGECIEAAKTWTVWQQAVRGFAPEEIPPEPKCP